MNPQPSSLMRLESELGSQIQALEAAALGRDPDALLAVASELEAAVTSMHASGFAELNIDDPADRSRIAQTLEQLQADMRKAFAVVAQRRDQTGAALQALGATSPGDGYGAGGYARGRVLGQA